MEAMGHEPQSGTSATAAGERARRWWILGRPSVVPPDSWRRRLRNRPVVAEAYRCAVFALGLLLIASGIALSVLPGPLTIPPVVLGLWVWSTEFAWAQRLFHRFAVKGRQAWAQAKAKPVVTSILTVAGLAAAAAMIWALRRYDVVDLLAEYVLKAG